jgi:hypothetical protein
MAQYKDLPIKTNPTAPDYEEGASFYARVHNDALELSPLVVILTHQLNIRSASTLLSYLKTFPQPVANVLGWSIDELNAAHQELLNTLKGIIPNQSTVERLEVSFGANKKE